MGRIIPYIMENKKCSKPPTSIIIIIYITVYIHHKSDSLPWLRPVKMPMMPLFAWMGSRSAETSTCDFSGPKMAKKTTGSWSWSKPLQEGHFEVEFRLFRTD